MVVLSALGLLLLATPAADEVDGGPSPSPSISVARHRLSIGALQAKGVEPMLKVLVEGKLCGELIRVSGWEALCPEDLEALASSAKGQVSFGACDSSDCQERVAALARSERIVQGTLARSGEELVLTVALIDGASGGVLSQVTEKLSVHPDRILDRIPAVARKLWK